MVDGNCLCGGERAAEELTPTVSKPGGRSGYCDVSLAERKRKPHGREFRFRGVKWRGPDLLLSGDSVQPRFTGKKSGFER